MKNLLQFLIILSSLVTFTVSASGVDDQIEWSKQEYKEIQTYLDEYQRYEFDYFGKSTEGGVGVGYVSDQGEIRYVEVTLYGESGKWRSEYYFHMNSPFFVIEQHFRYNVPFYMTEERAKKWFQEDGTVTDFFDPGKTKLSESSYYFDGEILIRIINTENKKAKVDQTGNSVYLDGIENLKRLREKIN
ncbi:MAG: hypothetical protein AB8D52_00975 [Gammaproteobacteria bacterium]